MIELRIDTRSGLPAYLQIVQQVKHAIRLGLIGPGEQLPSVRELVAALAINPNTVLKAYRELEIEGFVGGRPGHGTFVLETNPTVPPDDLQQMREGLIRWLELARQIGLDEESIVALFVTTMRAQQVKESAA